MITQRLFLTLLLLCGMLCPVLAVEMPKLLAPGNEAVGVTIPVTLRWSALTGTDRYDCDVARDAGFTDSVRVEQTLTGATLSLSHLLPGVRYYWHVRAHANKDDAAWSTTQSFTTSAALPAAARDGRVVCIAHSGRDEQIYIMNADGSDATKLTKLTMPSAPALSPDGRSIVFTRGGGDGYFGTGGLYLMNADGSGRRQLCVLPERVWSPHFNASGDTVLFALWENKGADRHLCTIRTDGTGFKRLPIAMQNIGDLAWSADAATIAVIEQNITLYAAGDYRKRLALPNPDHLQHDAGRFSRDGKTLISSAFADGGRKLLLDDADGGGQTCLATSEHIGAPGVSPDGSTILYSDKKGLHRISFSGVAGTAFPFPAGIDLIPGLDWQPGAGQWSPDPPTQVMPADHALKQSLPVRVSWTSRLGVTGYTVQVATDAGCQQVVAVKNQVTGSSIAMDNLKPLTLYYWRVRTQFREAAGSWSTVRSFTTAPAADTTYGFVRGMVSYEGGGAIPSAKVTVTIGQHTVDFVTDVYGAFAGLVPVGMGTAHVEGAEAPVAVKMGEVNNVTLIRKPSTGIILTVNFPDGTPQIYGVSASSRKSGAEPHNYMNPRVMRPGVYWFPDVPADDMEFAVIANLRGTELNGGFLHRWTFTESAVLRRLSLIIPAPVHVQLTIVNDDGKPLANTPVEGMISYTFHNTFNFWPESHREDAYTDIELKYTAKTMNTDAEGKLDLQNLAPNSYDVTLKAGTADGGQMSLEVKEDGAYTPQRYVVHTFRKVTQMLFHADGTPAANEEAFASFCQAGHVVIHRQVADTRGQVSWTDLPHRRVIVSGLHVTASVIPADGVAFPSALPPPIPGSTVEIHTKPEVKGRGPVTFGVLITAGTAVRSAQEQAELTRRVSGATLNETWSLPTGVPLQIFWGATTIPLQAHLLAGAYLPYADEGVRKQYLSLDTLPFTDYVGVTVKGRLTTYVNAPPISNDMLKIAPAPSNSLYELFQTGKLDWLLQSKLLPSGTFTATLLPTGPYDIRIGKAVQPALTFTVAGGKLPKELVVPRP